MQASDILLSSQEARRTKVKALCQGMQTMEGVIAEQQTRIQELENFIMWIYEVSTQGKTSSDITSAIENFKSRQSKKSQVQRYEQRQQEGTPRNLTFFPQSRGSQLSRSQNSSVQSVPMHESKINQIRYTETAEVSSKFLVQPDGGVKPSTVAFLKIQSDKVF